MFRILLLLLIGSSLWYYFQPEKVIHHEPGILVGTEPLQKPVQMAGWKKDEYKIEPLAYFSLNARVLSKNHYWMDKESDLASYDLALGWGQMSDESVVQKLKISQSSRWWYWRSLPGEDLPIAKHLIGFQGSNMHMIAANEQVQDILGDVIKGNIVSIKGYLVQVTDEKGYIWRSSMSRADVGKGACEIIWVEEIKILK